MSINDTDDHESTEHETPDDRPVEHDLGGVAVDLAGIEAFAPPEENGRVVVDTLEDEGPPIVTFAVRSDLVSGRLLLAPDRADAVADQLATAAAEARELEDE
jgi:hypothetical protein